MRTYFFRRLIVSLVAGSLLAVSGCAQVNIAPPSPELLSRLSEVGVVAVTAPSMKPPGEPVKGARQGMDSGIKQGARYSLAGGASLCLAQEPYSCAFGLVAGVLLTPPAAVIGGTLGALRARTKDEVEAAAK